jgi:platelet-activating factor acetylhydrolase IB subunit beta/gamma
MEGSMVFKPVMREDEHHVEKHAKILAGIKGAKIDVVFLGDSITRRWEDNPDLWEKYFARFNAFNMGVGADAIENVKWRALNGEIDGINPKLLVLLIGTNNLAANEAGEIAEGIIDLIGIAREKLPGTKILSLGIFPRMPDEHGTDHTNKIKAVNRELAEKLPALGVRFADVGDILLGADGKPNLSLMPDGLHLDHNGYTVLGPVLVRLLDSLI